MPSTTIVPAGKFINIQWRVNLGNTNNRIQCFLNTEEIELPNGLKTAYTIVSVKEGMKTIVSKSLSLTSQSMIYFSQRIQSYVDFTLLQAKERKADISTAQFSLNKDGTEMKEEQGNKVQSWDYRTSAESLR